jgi:hypothetical protein
MKRKTAIASAARWLLFVWGLFFAALYTFFAAVWHLGPDFGSGIAAVGAFFIGLTAWVALPLVCFFSRKNLSRRQIVMFGFPTLWAIAAVTLDMLLPSGTPQSFLP